VATYTYEEMEGVIMKLACYRSAVKLEGFDHDRYIQGFIEGVAMVRLVVNKSLPELFEGLKRRKVYEGS